MRGVARDHIMTSYMLSSPEDDGRMKYVLKPRGGT